MKLKYTITCTKCHQHIDDVTVVRDSTGYHITGICMMVSCGATPDHGGTVVDGEVKQAHLKAHEGGE